MSTAEMNLRDAVTVLRNAIMADDEVYNGFVASIYSALNDMPEVVRTTEAAEFILDRMIDN